MSRMRCYWLLVIWLAVLELFTCAPTTTSISETTKPSVESEKQEIIEIDPTLAERKVKDSTREILEKIAEVNKKHGLVKKSRPSYFHFPTSYFRSNEGEKNTNRQGTDFKFPTDPFTNPIFEYLEQDKLRQHNYQSSLFRQNQNLRKQGQGYVLTETNPEAPITEEDEIPGQYIKRKITHQQTFILPNPSMLMPIPHGDPQQSTFPFPNQGNFATPVMTSNKADEKNTLEKQTIENIKNIVSNSQVPSHNPYLFNPYQQAMVPQYQYPYQAPNPSDKSRQNWNWPGANFFPIYIRDPFLQMYYAVTNMVEYGPNAGSEGPCKLTPVRPNANRPNRIKNTVALREAKISEDEIPKVVFDTKNESDRDINIYEIDGIDKEKSKYINIEKENKKPVEVVLNHENNSKESRDIESGKALKTTWDKVKDAGKNKSVPSTQRQKIASKVTENKFRITSDTQSKQSPSVNHEYIFEDEQSQEEKTGVNISNEGTKKVFSKDNTGSGIFIHRIRVRKGGVAIAGPGGIATAGSGGTAIVGPNGVAYTHPDSLAIAGSGTKVVAVDPSVNLEDIVKNTSNRKPGDASTPRVGKVVALGPVVYYNRG